MTSGIVFLSLAIGPSPRALTIAEHPAGGDLLRVQRLPNGQLRVEVIQTDGADSLRTIWSVVSRPLITMKMRPIVFMAKWSDAGLFVEVDGELVASTDPTVTLPPALILTDIKPLNVVEDFSARNAASVTERAALLAKNPIRQNRKYPGKKFDLQRLRWECAALGDFLRLLRSGAKHHDLSIAKSVRTLLIPVKDEMGLLQRCAAHLSKPVIVYTINQPSLRPPIEPDSMLYVSISGIPEDIFRNPVDIDVWLQLPAAIVAGTEYTNHKFIKTIGDTRAAHADPGLHILGRSSSAENGVKTAGSRAEWAF